MSTLEVILAFFIPIFGIALSYYFEIRQRSLDNNSE